MPKFIQWSNLNRSIQTTNLTDDQFKGLIRQVAENYTQVLPPFNGLSIRLGGNRESWTLILDDFERESWCEPEREDRSFGRTISWIWVRVKLPTRQPIRSLPSETLFKGHYFTSLSLEYPDDGDISSLAGQFRTMSNLERLSIKCDFFSAVVLNRLAEGIAFQTRLQELDLMVNATDVNRIIPFIKYSYLRRFAFSAYPTAGLPNLIANAINNHPTLQQLEIHFYPGSSRSQAALCEREFIDRLPNLDSKLIHAVSTFFRERKTDYVHLRNNHHLVTPEKPAFTVPDGEADDTRVFDGVSFHRVSEWINGISDEEKDEIKSLYLFNMNL